MRKRIIQPAYLIELGVKSGVTTSLAERTALYRFYDADGQLLYVGITDRPGRRWETHMRRKRWWPAVHRQTLEWHPDRETAMAAEVAAIVNECPRHNIRHSEAPPKLFELTSAWTCAACGWTTRDPFELIKHVESEVAGKAGRRLAPGTAQRIAADAVKLQRTLTKAASLVSGAQETLDIPRQRSRRPRNPSPPMSAPEAKKLIADLDESLRADRVRLSDLPAILRNHDPGWEPYRKLTGLKIRDVLRAHGVRVTNTGNVLRLDPADLRQRVVMSREKGY